MIDKQTILTGVNLLDLIGGDFKRVAGTEGGEFAGACVFCGGRDRFRIQPYRRPWGLWMCRVCGGGRWNDAIGFIMQRDHVKFPEACRILAKGNIPHQIAAQNIPPKEAYRPPGEPWQANARRAIEECQEFLFAPRWERALMWLFSRGLSEQTIRHFRIGFSPGYDVGDMHIRRGIVIPTMAGGHVWRLKIALLPGDPVRCKCGADVKARHPCPHCDELNKYTSVKYSKANSIFNANSLLGASTALFCEGEFDAMITWQALGGILPVASVGSAYTKIDLATWGVYLLTLENILVSYDHDQAGQTGAAWWDALGRKVHRLTLPEGVHDLNDLYNTSIIQFDDWIMTELEKAGVLCAAS